MNSRVSRRAAQPAGAARPERAASTLRGPANPARVGASTCAALLTGVGLLLVAGCAGTGGASSGSTSSHGSAGAAFSGASGSSASAPLAPGATSAGAGQPDTAQATGLVAPDQSIIYTASLTVRVGNAARAAAAADGDVSRAGGYTAAEQARTSHAAGSRPRVTLTLKVPVAGYPAALRQLAGLGQQTALSQKSADVTQEVADVSSRVTSQQDAIAQLRTLLRRAGSVSGLLQVQDQISADESSLEALLAQQRSLAHETTYATVSVLLLGPLPRPAAAHHRSRHGFAAGLAAGWHGLRHATAWVLTALGVLLPFLAVLAVLAGIGWLARRRLTRHRAGPAHPTRNPAS
jgi:Domain of unknown function (DUF4349)